MRELASVEELNDIIYRIGFLLMNNKQKLSWWVAGIQQAFAELFVHSKRLLQEMSELEILKTFLVQRVETLKLKVYELLNEKEDMVAVH